MSIRFARLALRLLGGPMGQIGPTRAVCGLNSKPSQACPRRTNLGATRPKQIRPTLPHGWPNSAQVWLASSQDWSILSRVWPSSAEISQLGAKLGGVRFRPRSAQCRPPSTQDRSRHAFDQCGPDFESRYSASPEVARASSRNDDGPAQRTPRHALRRTLSGGGRPRAWRRCGHQGWTLQHRRWASAAVKTRRNHSTQGEEDEQDEHD